MRSPRKTADEQYALIMECRSSGLSDQQWCIQHNINPGTFYNWVKRLRKKACYDIPDPTGGRGVTSVQTQDVVKVDIIPDAQHMAKPSVVSAAAKTDDIPFAKAPIEIRFPDAVLSITNDIDPRLLAQILRNLGGCLC